jgi:drug/metabolite transporter (DMT)-like permease
VTGKIALQGVPTITLGMLRFGLTSLALFLLASRRTATFSNLVPVFGVLIAWLALGERLTPVQLLGTGLCLLGVWLCQRPARP